MKSTFIQLIKTGHHPLGTLLTLPCPEVAEAMADIGFDWLWIDMEHGTLSLRDAQQMLVAVRGKAHGLVRVPTCEPIWIRQVLDLGADGVIVPLVRSAAQAAEAIQAAKYPPQGARSAGIARANSFGLNFQPYVSTANSQTAILIQIEHIDAVRDIEAILALPGLDGIIVGPYDLSGSMNLLGQLKHPEVEAALSRVLSACKVRKIPIGIFAMTAGEAKFLRESGYDFAAVGIDATMLLMTARDVLNQARS